MTNAPIPGSLQNLDDDGVAKRRKLMIVALALVLAGLVAIRALEVERTWRLVLFVPLWFAMLCWFQAATKT